MNHANSAIFLPHDPVRQPSRIPRDSVSYRADPSGFAKRKNGSSRSRSRPNTTPRLRCKIFVRSWPEPRSRSIRFLPHQDLSNTRLPKSMKAKKAETSASLACCQLICEFDAHFTPTTAACPSHGHKWPINVAFKASLKQTGLASGEGYIELRGVEAFRWLADGESPSLVRGRTYGDISPSAAAGSLRGAITCGLGAGNGRGVGIMMGEGWLTA